MKKLSLLLFLIGSSFAFTQVKETETIPTQDQPEETLFSKDDKPAEYPGGMMALRKDVADKIKTNRIRPIKGILVSKAKFIFNIKGKIENIVVTGDHPDLNREIERAIKSLKTRWKPAESRGIIVRSYYSFPVTLEFE